MTRPTTFKDVDKSKPRDTCLFCKLSWKGPMTTIWFCFKHNAPLGYSLGYVNQHVCDDFEGEKDRYEI